MHARVLGFAALFTLVVGAGGHAAPANGAHLRPLVAPVPAPADTGLAGHWEAQMQGDSKIFVFTFDFVVTGDKLTGSVEAPSMDAKFPITNGMIKGNEISFSAFGLWTGKLAGKELSLTRELDYGKKQTMTARRTAGSREK